MTVQEEYITKLDDMMNIHIGKTKANIALEENLVSKLTFLNNSKERNSIIEKANKQVNHIRYPAPMPKLREDREIEALLKDIKKKPQAKRKESSRRQKDATPVNSKKEQTKTNSHSSSFKTKESERPMTAAKPSETNKRTLDDKPTSDNDKIVKTLKASPDKSASAKANKKDPKPKEPVNTEKRPPLIDKVHSQVEKEPLINLQDTTSGKSAESMNSIHIFAMRS